MARHALREAKTPNADPSKLGANTIVGPRTAAEVVAQLKARTEPLVKRKDAVRCVELFVGASPEVMRSMSRAEQDEYFADSLRWIAAKFGGDRANIVFAAVHRDETTPHVQVLLTPIVGGKLAANSVLGGPAGLVKLQDEFAAQVGEKHGMRRGERGSRARHTSVRAFYGAIEAAGSADALPKAVRVPPAPEPLGLFASAAAKRAHAAVQKAREVALAANRMRQEEIERLALLGLATHGRGRRRLPKQLSDAEAVIQQARGAGAVVRQALDLLDRLNPVQRAEVKALAKADLVKQERANPRQPKGPKNNR